MPNSTALANKSTIHPWSTNDPALTAECRGTNRFSVAVPTPTAHANKSTIYPQSTNDPAPKAERRGTTLSTVSPLSWHPRPGRHGSNSRSSSRLRRRFSLVNTVTTVSPIITRKSHGHAFSANNTTDPGTPPTLASSGQRLDGLDSERHPVVSTQQSLTGLRLPHVHSGSRQKRRAAKGQ